MIYIKGNLPNDFSKSVQMLTRPYVPVTEEFYQEVIKGLIYHNCDFFLHADRVCTVGMADGRYQVMPVRSELQNKMKKKVIK